MINRSPSYLELSMKSELDKYVDPTLSINDKNVRHGFLTLLEVIIAHYQTSEKTSETGMLEHFIQAGRRINTYLDGVRDDRWGYFNLAFIAVDYIKEKLLGHDYIFTGELGEAKKILDLNSPEVDGKKKFRFKVTCDAERDVALLFNAYMNFFLLEGPKYFDSRVINSVLKTPGLSALITKAIQKNNDKMNAFEMSHAETATTSSTVSALSPLGLR